MIDFSKCKVVPGRAYNGANGSKIGVNYNGSIYMLKFPPSASGKPTELSYTNGCISEHLGSSIFNILGIKAQETLLGTFTVNGKVKTVCACKDFTSTTSRLFDFCSIKNTVLESDSNGNGTELDDIIDAFDKQTYVSPSVLIEHFWDMFIVDALLGNFDRHNGNWGFLYNEESGSTEIAPVFDCGSCLLPQADDTIMQNVLSNEADMHARIFQFPTSAIKLNGRKINYYDFIHSTSNDSCNAALLRLFPRINLEKIDHFIDQTEGITDLQKNFYRTYIRERYSRILLPSYNLISSS